MKECELYKKESGNNTRCLACAHKCFIPEGKSGICGVRKNINGKLMLLVYGKIAAMHIDPIEKKPFYHFLPGSYTYSIGTLGCNFKCGFCQNHEISQSSKGYAGEMYGDNASAEEIVSEAKRTKCKSIAYTYNEPIIFSEFIKDCSKLARENGLKNIIVTNGYWSEESFEYLKDSIDAANIDLKFFSERLYKNFCGGDLKPVLDTIKRCHNKGIHIEITTLVIPGLNDNPSDFEKIAKFISDIDDNIPWHITRFFPHYNMMDVEITPIKSLETGYRIGKKHLKNVYMGNV